MVYYMFWEPAWWSRPHQVWGGTLWMYWGPYEGVDGLWMDWWYGHEVEFWWVWQHPLIWTPDTDYHDRWYGVPLPTRDPELA